MTIRILLVDDEQLVRAGLAMILAVEDDLEIVGFASRRRGCGAQGCRTCDPTSC